MVIWSGWGFITAILFVVGIFVGITVIGDEYGAVVGLVLMAIINFLIGRALNNPTKDRIVVDQDSGERIALKKRSTLFFIPMQWWSVVMIVFAVIDLFNLSGK